MNQLRPETIEQLQEALRLALRLGMHHDVSVADYGKIVWANHALALDLMRASHALALSAIASPPANDPCLPGLGEDCLVEDDAKIVLDTGHEIGCTVRAFGHRDTYDPRIINVDRFVVSTSAGSAALPLDDISHERITTLATVEAA